MNFKLEREGEGAGACLLYYFFAVFVLALPVKTAWEKQAKLQFYAFYIRNFSL